jgi:hypothetical protein
VSLNRFGERKKRTGSEVEMDERNFVVLNRDMRSGIALAYHA